MELNLSGSYLCEHPLEEFSLFSDGLLTLIEGQAPGGVVHRLCAASNDRLIYV